MLIELKTQSRSYVTIVEEKSFRFYYLNHLSSDHRVVQQVTVCVEIFMWGSLVSRLPSGSSFQVFQVDWML